MKALVIFSVVVLGSALARAQQAAPLDLITKWSGMAVHNFSSDAKASQVTAMQVLLTSDGGADTVFELPNGSTATIHCHNMIMGGMAMDMCHKPVIK